MPKLIKRMPRAYYQARVEKRYSPAANLAAPGFTASMTAPSIAGVMVTPQTALTFSAYYAGVRVISEDVASLPLAMFQRLPGGGSKLELGHPVTRLFNRSPDGEVNDLNWREAQIGHILGWGNGYSEIEWSKQGEPLSLTMIHPSTILPKRGNDGKLFYEIQTTTAQPTGRSRDGRSRRRGRCCTSRGWASMASSVTHRWP